MRLLPLVLLHQRSHAPVGILNLLIHAAVPGGDNHKIRGAPAAEEFFCLQKGQGEAEEKEVRKRRQQEKCQFSYQGSPFLGAKGKQANRPCCFKLIPDFVTRKLQKLWECKETSQGPAFLRRSKAFARETFNISFFNKNGQFQPHFHTVPWVLPGANIKWANDLQWCK